MEEQNNDKFRFALTSKEQQERIIRFISPIKDEWDVINLWLGFGVQDKSGQVLIARTRADNKRDEHTGILYETTSYVGFVRDKGFQISYTVEGVNGGEPAWYNVPEEYEDIFKEALDYARNYNEQNVFEKNLQETAKISSLKALDNQIKDPLWYQVEKIQNTKPKKHREITCEEDAKKVFDEGGIYVHTYFDKQTVSQYEKYADDAKKQEWALSECYDILNEIIHGNTDRLYKKLITVSGRTSWVKDSDKNDELLNRYMQACEQIFASEPEISDNCIESVLDFVKHFVENYNPLHGVPLLDMTEAYMKRKYVKTHGTEEGIDKLSEARFIARIKGIISERAPMENTRHFRFVLMPEDMLQRIVMHYKEQYNNDMKAVKEVLAEFNAAYGVANEEVFLAAVSAAADSLLNHTWDIYRFIAVLTKTNEVLEIKCKKDAATGQLKPEYFDEKLDKNWELLSGAMSFFRNEIERNRFYEECEKNTGKNHYQLRKEENEKLFNSFGSGFDALLERIGDNPLKDTLIKFVEMCEAVAPQCGFQNVVVNEAATLGEIAQWEQEKNMKLPEEYKNLLLFANGVRIGGDKQIYGLSQIEFNDEIFGEDYYSAGCMVSIETEICFSKSTGKVYMLEDDEYEEYPDFKDLLEKWIDLCMP